MAVTTKAKIHTVILSTGIAICFFGIILFTAGFKIKSEIKHYFPEEFYDIPRDSQYWAALPVIITGIFLIVAAFVKEQAWLKILCGILLLVSMVVTMAVIVEEQGSYLNVHHRRQVVCQGVEFMVDNRNDFKYGQKDCEKFKSGEAWYQILLLFSDIVSVLCLVALLAIFADWILFNRKGQQQCYEQFRSGNGGYPPSAEHGGIVGGHQESPPPYNLQPLADPNIQMVHLPPDNFQ